MVVAEVDIMAVIKLTEEEEECGSVLPLNL